MLEGIRVGFILRPRDRFAAAFHPTPDEYAKRRDKGEIMTPRLHTKEARVGGPSMSLRDRLTVSI